MTDEGWRQASQPAGSSNTVARARRDRQVGLTAEISEDWIEAVRAAAAPPDYSADIDEPTEVHSRWRRCW